MWQRAVLCLSYLANDAFSQQACTDAEGCCALLPAQLNGRSSVLRCSLGMALAKMGKPAEAMVQLDAAIAADRSNPLARFEKAGVLLAGERFQEALSELGTLRVRECCLPDQASHSCRSIHASTRYYNACSNGEMVSCTNFS